MIEIVFPIRLHLVRRVGLYKGVQLFGGIKLEKN